MNSWQEFLYANTFISRKSMMTLSVGLTMFQGENVTEWALLFAGTSIATVPIILLFLGLQKYYLAGMTSGALKG
jgi:ABC-type glycerol-3-phosphate transport system permease component